MSPTWQFTKENLIIHATEITANLMYFVNLNLTKEYSQEELKKTNNSHIYSSIVQPLLLSETPAITVREF